MNKRTIVVTGGAGHVGSHVIEMLVADPANRVISLDNYSNGSVDNHIEGAEYREGHTKDIERLVPETPALLYHLGEYARIKTSFDDVRMVHDFNAVGTFAVAEFCRARRAKLTYAASSTKFEVGYRGRDQNPYAFTKAANVDLIRNYGRWFSLDYAICYFYNAYGPRERSDGRMATLIARFERLYLQGQPLTVDKPGTQLRAFTYVKDLAQGIILVGQRGRGDGYALAAEKKYSVLQIAEAFGGPVVMRDEYSGRADAENDATKARTQLGWAPTMDVMDYIREFRRQHPRLPARS
jgi:UDP-glucose 4-epimerase